MIFSISSDHETFRTVHLKSGLNLIVADKQKESKDKDTRNGSGKTMLMQIINFCLGSDAARSVVVKELNNWTFIMDIKISGERFKVKRNTLEHGKIIIEGNTDILSIQPKNEVGVKYYSVDNWKALLGNEMFGLALEDDDEKFVPSFRSLISYFLRTDSYAYTHPFHYFSKQSDLNSNLNTAYLLNLSWNDVRDRFVLLESQKKIDEIVRIIKRGVFDFAVGSRGELEAEEVRVQNKLNKVNTEINSFKVHEQYKDIENEANLLTEEIHLAVDENVISKNLINLYESGLSEALPESDMILKFYSELNIELPGMVVKRFEEVSTFHKEILKNRKSYILEELNRLREKLDNNNISIKDKSDKRANLLSILETHGALEEYNKLSNKSAELAAKLAEIKSRISEYKKIDDKQSELREKEEKLYRRSIVNYESSKPAREQAITLFNQYTEFLYNSPGNLVIEANKDKGFFFNIDIQRAGSKGIDSMKTFCYDLMLASLWSQKKGNPGFLMHDSIMFDGVDERQIASALRLAHDESEKYGFQYICTINTDDIPPAEYLRELDIENYIRLTLTDNSASGGLLGMRY